jgi:hypothetical protein
MKILVLAFSIFSIFVSLAQDERQFRDLFAGEFDKNVKDEATKEYKYVVNTPLYKVDLNSDHRKESIFYEAKDGESWIHILGYDQTRVKSFKFETNGIKSRVYKVRLKKLSDETLALVVYFYEGMVEYTELNSTSRLYFITIDKNSLESMRMFKGPIFWEEKRTVQKHYHQRPNFLSFVDLNKNGTREIIVKQGQNSSVFMYRGEGKWISF